MPLLLCVCHVVLSRISVTFSRSWERGFPIAKTALDFDTCDVTVLISRQQTVEVAGAARENCGARDAGAVYQSL